MDNHQIEPHTMTCSDPNLFEWASLSNRTRQTLHDLYRSRPFRRDITPMPPMTFKDTSSVFVPSKVTSHLISSSFIQRRFQSTKRLFQFLNWTMRINKSTQNMAVMEGRNGRKVLLFDIELHDPRGQSLYALCTPNITKTPNVQPWCLGALLTADTITKWMDIEYQMLPRGIRAVSPHFEQYRKTKDNLQRVKRDILEIDAQQKGHRYNHLRCIRRKHSKDSAKKMLTVRFSEFYEIVQSALKDDNVNLIPIVSIVSRKSMVSDTNLLDFSVDYLLPVQVDGNWIGVVYRDGQCIMTLMDHYDITNKAIQCDPSFDIRSMDWFTNNYNRFRIIPDIPRKMRKSKKGRFTKYIRTSTLSENGFNSHSELLQQDVVSDSEDTPTSPSHSAMSSSWKDQETHVGPIAVSIDSVVKVPAQIISSPPTPILPPSAIALPVPPVPVLQPQNGKMQIHTHCPCRFCQSKQQWIQWMDRTIQAAVSEANYFMDIRRQYIGC